MNMNGQNGGLFDQNLMPKGKGRQWLLYKGPYTSQQLGVLPCLDRSCSP